MNKETTTTFESDPLESLFASARQTQPTFLDDNFTKTLLNSLPRTRVAVRKDTSKKGLSFDLIGAIVGLVMAYLFIDRTSLLNSLLNLVPETISISPLLVMSAVGAIALSSVVAWWAVEDSRL